MKTTRHLLFAGACFVASAAGLAQTTASPPAAQRNPDHSTAAPIGKEKAAPPPSATARADKTGSTARGPASGQRPASAALPECATPVWPAVFIRGCAPLAPFLDVTLAHRRW